MLRSVAAKAELVRRKLFGEGPDAIDDGTEPVSRPNDSFCIYPFKSLNIIPSGSVKPCCVYAGAIGDGERGYSVYDHQFRELWNCQSMREIRRGLVENQEVPGCDYCFAQERKGLRSMRLEATEAWSAGFLNPEGETVAQVKEQARANDFWIPSGPEHLDLDVGNLCNLKCRMCNSTFSSRIAKDPVHTKWWYPPEIDAKWRGKELVIAPQAIVGATYKGFAGAQLHGGALRSWTDGRASVRLPLPDVEIVSISLRLTAPAGSEVSVVINERTVFSGPISNASWNVDFERTAFSRHVPVATWHADFQTPFLAGANALEIEISSSLFVAESTWVDFGIDEIRLTRSSKGRNNLAVSRFNGGAHWYQDERFLIDELLADPHRIRKLNVIGGEPLAIQEVRTILRHLIDAGVASQVTLVLTTNGTCADDEWFELSSHFKQVCVAISVDGHGPVNEYIRFPSVWTEVKRNIEIFQAQRNAVTDVNMTIQALNLLDVSDLVETCDRIGVRFRCHFLHHPPYLSPYVIPHEIRMRAAARIRDLVERRKSSEIGAAYATSNVALVAVASALESGPSIVDAARLREFMTFTNDLDKSRGQDVRTALPELVEQLELHGYPWSNETRYWRS